MRTPPLDSLNLLRNPLTRLLPIVQKARTDLAAPDPKILPRLATRRPNSTPHQPRRPRLLPQLLGQKRNQRPRHAMPRAPSVRSPFLPDRRPEGPSSQHQNSATYGHRHYPRPHRLVPQPQIPNPNPPIQSTPSEQSPPKSANRSKLYRLGPYVLRPNLPRLSNCA
jgi:hypothetical protein